MEKWDFIDYVKSQDDFRIVVLGVTRSGKTIWLKKLITQLIAYKKLKIFVCDTKHEFDRYKEFDKKDLNQKSFVRKLQVLKNGNEKDEDKSKVAEFCCAVAWNFPPSMVYIEELPEVVKQSEKLPSSHKLLYKVLQQGAANKVNLMVASQMISQTNWAFIRQASDIFIFAVKPHECRKIEEALSLEKGSINFDLPTKKEIKNKIFKDLYTFYHVDTLSTPIHYEKIKITSPGRKKKLIQPKKMTIPGKKNSPGKKKTNGKKKITKTAYIDIELKEITSKYKNG